MTSSEIVDIIVQTINTIFNTLFSSIDNNIYENLDNITFLNSDLIKKSSFEKLLGANGKSRAYLFSRCIFSWACYILCCSFLLSEI